jgi:hypothetical protein
MKHLSTFLTGLALTLGLAMNAAAVEYKVIQPEKSKVTFQYKQMGVAMEGRFKKFAAQLNFDPAKPAAAKADIEIDLASIDAGSSDADDEVVGKTWFNVKAFPKATFVAKQIKANGSNQFDVTGVLTIKGKTSNFRSSWPRKAPQVCSRVALSCIAQTLRLAKASGPNSMWWPTTSKLIFNSPPFLANNFSKGTIK